MPTRNSRERNERGQKLFWQNLKGVVGLFLSPNEIAWSEEVVEQTTRRLEEAFGTLSIMARQVHPADDVNRDGSRSGSLNQLLDYIKSLYSSAKSCEIYQFLQ